MIDIGKELFYVAFQAIHFSPGGPRCPEKIGGALHARQDALANTAGGTVKNHGFLEDWLNDIAKGVMDDTIPEGQRSNQAFLRFIYGKVFVTSHLITLPNEVV